MNRDSTVPVVSVPTDTQENQAQKRRYTTASEVSPSLSVRDKRARKLNEEELMEDLVDVSDELDEERMLHPFPFYGMRKLFRSTYTPNGIDPRGPILREGEKEHPMWQLDHCMFCECEKKLCHDTRFGLYCGLRVAEMIEEKGAGDVQATEVSKLLKVAYNEILRVETVQQIGVLDTYNDYDPPKCILEKSMKNIMRHFLYEKYTLKIKKRLQDGSRGRWGTGKYGFYTALHNDKQAEQEIDDEESA